ncbi:hypothetical protein AB0N05_36695 [Nocardia sp. NPDC051030]|uniref:hypothetical protein n=1 Tax=Nocardia sp. NPDC051030 TaxID=3155162 RepID=UPI00341762F4
MSELAAIQFARLVRVLFHAGFHRTHAQFTPRVFTGPVDHTVSAVMRAIEAGDWTEFAKLVHPYVHWTEDEHTTRGRTRVMALLSGRGGTRGPSQKPATSYELRDEQVYRWNS